MSDSITTIAELKNAVKKFCDDRDWNQFHNPKEISIGIMAEAAELIEHFRWCSEKECLDMFKDPKKKEEIADELSDVFYWVLRFAQKYEIDLSDGFNQKMRKNAEKYPISKAKGSKKKYTEL
jgi:NTP pyrophosphatase (non-canonical NTP hydrolase)